MKNQIKQQLTDSENDTQDYVCSISSEEFEVFCKELIQEYAIRNHFQDFSISHDVHITGYDGTYQIDIYATYKSVLDTEIKIICECKQYKDKVKRNIVQNLDGKVRSLGANKGILLSTSGFQSGAVLYAKKHGIDLIQVFDHGCKGVSHSGGPNCEYEEDDPLVYAEKHWPKYRAICFMPDQDETVVLYPTGKMVIDIYTEMSKLAKKKYGFELPLEEIKKNRSDLGSS